MTLDPQFKDEDCYNVQIPQQRFVSQGSDVVWNAESLKLQTVLYVRHVNVNVIDGAWTLVSMPETLPDQVISVLGSCT